MYVTTCQAKRIRLALLALDRCGSDLAKPLGRSVSSVSHWLNGRSEAPDDFIKRVEEILGLRTGILDGDSLDLARTITTL